MPELPEVETTCRGISPFLLHQTVTDVVVRERRLRKPVPENFSQSIGQTILEVKRRGKYLIIQLSQGSLLVHLGMSGHLKLCHPLQKSEKHDHIDLVLTNERIVRYHDPRRFGLMTYITEDPLEHPLLKNLGPEPLTDALNGSYLYACSRKKRQSVKSFLMTNQIMVGVGNIYATESLFLAGIHPLTPVGTLSLERLTRLATSIKTILQQAIDSGGTTLRDFYSCEGKPGYFVNELKVYGRTHLPCVMCQSLIEVLNIAGRSSAYCPNCQMQSV